MKHILFIALLLSVGFLPRQAHARTLENSPEMYTPISGDTLSQVVTDQCGKTSLWPSVAAANHLVSPYRIYVGRAIKISCEKTLVVKVIHPVVKVSVLPKPEPEEIASTDMLAPIATEDGSFTLLSFEAPAPTPAPVVTTIAQSPAPAPSPTSEEKAPAKPAKITGYKLVLPQEAAATLGIPLKTAITTWCSTYNERGKQVGFVRLSGISFARQEGEKIVLYVPLQNIPEQSFKLSFAGINDPIDGTLFTASAQPVYGKLPRPHNEMRTLFSVLSLGGSGYALSAALGPIAGPSVAVGMLATREILRHHANAMVIKAEKEFNAALAKGNTPTERESGQ